MHGGNIYQHDHIKIDFSANCSLNCPPQLITAAKTGVDHAMIYPDINCRKLREKTAMRYARRFACTLQPEHIIPGNGASELIYAAVRAVRPMQALLTAPGFSEYERALTAAEVPVTYYAFGPDNPLAEDFLKAVDSLQPPGMVILSNPNNPTGQMIPKELLLQILARCKNRHTVLIDECFLEFTRADSLLSELDQCPELMILSAYTKIFAIPGLRLGFLLSKNESLLQAVHRQIPAWNINAAAMQAGIAAAELEYPDETDLQSMEAERMFMQEQLKKRGYTVYPGAANFLFFTGQTGLYEKLLRKGMLIRDCRDYKNVQEGSYRICIRSRSENEALLRAMDES